MAKGSKGTDRRAVVEEMRRKQQAAEKRRTRAILLACVLVAVVIVAAAAIPLIKQRQQEAKGIDEIGVAASAAGCGKVVTDAPQGDEASGSGGNHVNPPAEIDYRHKPPAFGQHWPNFLTGSEIRTFYTVDDRPEVQRLVHSLEHGYTILWYDQSVADDKTELDQVKEIANRFDAGDKFIAAPWTSADGGDGFQDGAHLALTHWSMGGTNGNPKGQLGIWQYCDAPSGEAVQTFTQDYPFADSPEPGAA